MDETFTALTDAGLPVTAACRLVGRARASHYRHALPPVQGPKPRRSPGPQALTPAEQAAVLQVINSTGYADLSVGQIWARELDEGRYWCSMSSMYRIARAAGQTRERRRQATHPAKVKPELVADAPSQVWSWDIERHEAPFDRAGDERTPPPARRSGPGEAEGSLIPGTGVRAVSSPDNAGTAQYCQMVRARQARRRGIREEPAAESPSRRSHQLEPGGSGLGCSAHPRHVVAGNSLAG